jgi:dTDP-glucose 4,6-dehydratase
VEGSLLSKTGVFPNMHETILVTGGAGFIGSNFILEWMTHVGTPLINLDKLTYAGNLKNLSRFCGEKAYRFENGDIADREFVRGLLREAQPRAVVHFAAESHVDRSILGPDDFVRTNVVGTFSLLEETRAYCAELQQHERDRFRFLHISTDEVYGSLGPNDPAFREESTYRPNSPYSATKAASDHLVRAYFHTYGLPVVTTNCSNNYGPYQFPEKLIPLMILNARCGKRMPVYGDGQNVRDWLYVGDHCAALRRALEKGVPGETYNVGGRNEKRNVEIVQTICELLDELCPNDPVIPHSKLIEFVKDRPGHDRRYAVDTTKIERELGWRPKETFETGIRKTIHWYLENEAWVEDVSSGAYRDWIAAQYSDRGHSSADRARQTK